MKIALLSSLYGVDGGGAGMVVQQLAEGLARKGHQVVVITTGQVAKTTVSGSANLKIIIFRPAVFYLVQEKDMRPLWQRFFWQLLDIYNPVTGRRLAKILQEEKPDIIHIHKMRGLSGSVWHIAVQQSPGRVVQTCHDFESISPMGTLAGRIGGLALDGKWPLSWYQSLRAFLSRHVVALTAPSAFALDTIVQRGVFPDAKRYVVPNTHGFTLAELDSMHTRAVSRARALHLLFLGRLEPEKGLRELCAAFEQVAPRLPALHLTIAGWGSLEAELRTAYAAHPAIRCAGKVFGPEKARLFAEADIVVAPSTGLESFGMVAVEAFAYGKPVIAANSSGLAELVRNGETGWLVQPDSVSNLARVIAEVAAYPEAPARMAPACFDAAKQFTIDKILGQYERVYSDVQTRRDHR